MQSNFEIHAYRELSKRSWKMCVLLGQYCVGYSASIPSECWLKSATLFLVCLPASVRKRAEHGPNACSLPPVCKTRMEFRTPGFGPAHLWLLCSFGEWTRQDSFFFTYHTLSSSLCVSLPFKKKFFFQKKEKELCVDFENFLFPNKLIIYFCFAQSLWSQVTTLKCDCLEIRCLRSSCGYLTSQW